MFQPALHVARESFRLEIYRPQAGNASHRHQPAPQPRPPAPRRPGRWRRFATRLSGKFASSIAAVFGRRSGRAIALCLTVASTSVPAGTPDKTESTQRLKQQREVMQRTAQVVEQAHVAHITSRYPRPPEQVRRVVRTTQRVAERHGLPPELLLAMMETESSFNPAARSNYGALGLMQVVPRFHPKVVKAVGGVHRLDEPEANIEAGATILAAYVESSGSLHKALHRYSGGARSYATRIIKRQREFENAAIYATRQLDNMRISELRNPDRRG
jgi:soluble lytic murein transglycosylase-like protein